MFHYLHDVEDVNLRKMTFKDQIRQGIPEELPLRKEYNLSINHAPKRKTTLSAKEKNLALQNALRYFDPKHHKELLPEFKEELETYGRIYMYRFRPDYKMFARPMDEYPGKSLQAKSIMLMIQNNLDYAVAQHPHELITYGGNGAVFQNWAQYLLTMKYLSEMNDRQTLVMYSGHPMGLFPSHKNAPRVVVTNGMMIPNYSKSDDWEKFNALGVTQYGQMTAGSYMYIGPQEVKDFSESITVNIEIDKNLYNPNTGHQVKIGDQLSLYSYELEKDTWAFEKEVTISGSGDELFVNFDTDHLTDYSIVAELPVCSDIFEINNPTEANIQAKIELEITGSTATRTYKIIEQNLVPGINKIPYNGIGDNISLKLYASGEVLTVNDISCGESPAIMLPQPDSELVTITINIPCEDVELNVASYPIKYRKQGETEWINGVIKDLRLKSYEMEAGNTYEFQIQFDGETYTYEEYISSKNYQFDVDSKLCNEINF